MLKHNMSQLKAKKKNKNIGDKNHHHGYSTRRNAQKNCELCKGYEEKVKILQSALKEVIEQNGALRSRVAELEALISEFEDQVLESS